MRDFLPQAEAELKFRALPDDEMAIVQLIEKHEVKHSVVLSLLLKTYHSSFHYKLMCT